MQLLMQVAEKSLDSATFDDVVALARDDMQAVDRLISESLESDVALVSQVSQYIVTSGGKRLRPLLVLLAARALGYDDEQHVRSAAIIEFIHTATLLHDDVVDSSARRRGKDTANTVFGNQASVLVGDFLYSRAFQMMVDCNSMRVMGILSDATNTIAEGEVLQLLNCNDPHTTEERYMDVIHYKTAKLFEAAGQLGAIISDVDPEKEFAMAKYGMFLGTAFQLVDDVLDYSSSSEEIGKNIGDDLAEGKPTLPLIRAMKTGSTEQARLIQTAIANGGREHITEVIKAIESTDAIEYTANIARQEANKAKDILLKIPESQYRDALASLADFSISRTY